MDTTSHVVIGLGLGALAYIDPAVASDPTLATAVLVGTVLGSNAPDLDYVCKLKGNAFYYRHHRGVSHSLPVLPIWALLVSLPIFLFTPTVSFSHLFLWSLIAVCTHVITDLFNVYGTQALQPLSEKWIAFDSVPLFDILIIFLHLIGFSLIVSTDFQPSIIFSIIYTIIALYIAARTFYARWIKHWLASYFTHSLQIKILPRMSFLHWGVIIETEADYLFGSFKWGELVIDHCIEKEEHNDVIVDCLRLDDRINHFLSSTNYAYPIVIEKKDGYLVYWKDLRFRSKKFFPFMAIGFISKDLNEIASYTGWFHHPWKLRRVVNRLVNKSTYPNAN